MNTTLSSPLRRRFAAVLAASALLFAPATGLAHAHDDGAPAVDVEILWADIGRSTDDPGPMRDLPGGQYAHAAMTAQLTIRPGGRLSWRHHGSVAISVTDGTLVSRQGPDCVEHTYSSHEAFVGRRNQVHSVGNPGPDDLVLRTTFYGVSDRGWITPAMPLVDRCSDAGAGSTGFSSSGDSIRWFTME